MLSMTRSAPPQVAVVMFGARRHYAVPRILHAAGRLQRFYTDITAVQGVPRLLSGIPTPWLPKPLRRLKGRIPHDIPRELITSFPALGLHLQWRLARCRTAEEFWRQNERTAADLARRLSARNDLNADVLYAFSTEGLEVMEHAKARGVRCVLDQTNAPIPVLNQLVQQERLSFPGWETDISGPSDLTRFNERERREWELADLILCGSEFVRKGIEACGGPVDRCRVVSYGVDRRPQETASSRRSDPHQPLRVLTVGQVCLRKGAPYVLAAAERLGDQACFRMVGPLNLSAVARDLLQARVELTGQVPRSEVADHYRWADVFLLPTLAEGSAGVVYEALSMGLPVICTPNAGSLVRDGRNGFIVPVRDPDAIAEILLKLHADRELLHHLADQAAASGPDYGFDSYRDRLIRCLDCLPATAGTGVAPPSTA